MREIEVHAKHSLSEADASELQKLTAGGLVSQALASGEVNSIREALRKKNLAVPVDRALRHMQICLRNVRGSEAERDTIMYKFAAIRIWSGCSSLFFILNPHDIRSPLTVLLLQSDFQFEKSFSLDVSDEEVAQYNVRVLGTASTPFT